MKKNAILAIILIILMISLSGCYPEQTKTIKGWALHYAKQEYEKEQEDYYVIAFNVTEYIMFDIEHDYEDHYVKMFKIEFVEDNGRNITYNVFIVYGNRINITQDYSNYYKENEIIDVDIEVVD